MSEFLIRARTFLLIAAIWLTIGWGSGFLRRVDSSLATELPAWVRFPGVIAMAAGGAVMIGCGLMLSTVGIGSLSGDERLLPRDFLATGPFRFVRNPMSLGAIVLMVGIALWHRSTMALVLAAAMLLIAHLFILIAEEPGLEKRFGESYRIYKLNVPRWTPRLTPWRGSEQSQQSR